MQCIFLFQDNGVDKSRDIGRVSCCSTAMGTIICMRYVPRSTLLETMLPSIKWFINYLY